MYTTVPLLVCTPSSHPGYTGLLHASTAVPALIHADAP